jgi:hypothetical protein
MPDVYFLHVSDVAEMFLREALPVYFLILNLGM